MTNLQDESNPDMHDLENTVLAIDHRVLQLFEKLKKHEEQGHVVMTENGLNNSFDIIFSITTPGLLGAKETKRFAVKFDEYVNPTIRSEIERSVNKLRLLYAQRVQSNQKTKSERSRKTLMSI
jgi:hypothetical protein